jgi:peptidoglycan/LPS O-acetylase OafA/YrhL
VTASAQLEAGTTGRTERAFPCLDGARALAATAVVVTHCSYWAGDQSDTLLGRSFARLDVGVAVFFVLSGFLLSRPLFLAAARHRPGPRAAAYLWRRAVRILPLYWLTVAGALLFLPGNAQVGAGGWLRHLALVQIYGNWWFGEGLTHTWSLCTEVAFYLVLPVAGAALVRLARVRPERPTAVLVALAVTTLLSLAWVAWEWAARPFGLPTDLWLPGYAGWFCGGMALAVLTVSDPLWRPVRVAHDLGGSLPTCWAGAAALFWIATSTVAGPLGLAVPTPVEAVTKSVLYLGVAVLFVLPLVVPGPLGTGRRLLASPPVRFVGEISYGIFLVHMPLLVGGYHLLGWAPFTGNMVLVLVVTWILAALLATAIYLAVERPMRRVRSLVPDRPSSRPALVSEATSEASVTTASI